MNNPDTDWKERIEQKFKDYELEPDFVFETVDKLLSSQADQHRKELEEARAGFVEVIKNAKFVLDTEEDNRKMRSLLRGGFIRTIERYSPTGDTKENT